MYKDDRKIKLKILLLNTDWTSLIKTTEKIKVITVTKRRKK